MACAWTDGTRESATPDLVPCSLCRASFHRECCDRPEGRGPQLWTCAFCSALLDRPTVRLSHWSLELVQQPSGRIVPVVMGVRSDKEGPPGMLWRSSEIIHAMTPTALITRSRMVIRLSGRLSLRLAAKLQLPLHLRQQFKLGFPVMAWLSLVKYCHSSLPSGLEAAISACPAPVKSDEKRNAADEQRTRKRPRSTSGWSQEDTLRLKCTLSDVRPSTPHFWQQVAARVGRPVHECQQHAFGPVRSPARKQITKPAPICDAGDLAENDGGPTCMVNVPKKDGPRRAQRINAFLQAKCFGNGSDMLDMPAESTASEAVTPCRRVVRTGSEPERSEADENWMAPSRTFPEAPSPGCMNFLQSLHTGCTPLEKSRKPVAGHDRLAEPAAGPQRPCSAGGAADCSEFYEADGMSCQSLLDLGDLSWQPKGVDSFICETRAKRGRLATTSKNACTGSPARPLRAANLRKAEALFSKLDKRGKAEAAMEGTPKSVASDSEDEAAPLAAIPPPTWTTSVGS